MKSLENRWRIDLIMLQSAIVKKLGLCVDIIDV